MGTGTQSILPILKTERMETFLSGVSACMNVYLSKRDKNCVKPKLWRGVP